MKRGDQPVFKKEIEKPILALIFLSLGGWLMHTRAHPVSFDPANPANPLNLLPFLWGLASVVAVPILLSFRSTVIVGYLLNGIGVIVGSLMMGMISVAHPPQPITFPHLFLRTMLGAILLLFPKLFLGQMVLLHYHPNGLGRLFTLGWWTRHFIYLTAIFALGHVIWR